jgi:hypothetical protein
MNSHQKAMRGLRALFVLGFILTTSASVVGGYVVAAGSQRPSATIALPLVECGQVIMFFGLLNLFVYVCMFFATRRLFLTVNDNSIA